MVKLNVDGDWSPRLRAVDIVERWASIRPKLLRNVIEGQLVDLKVTQLCPGSWTEFVRCLRGRGLTAPFLVLNVKGERTGEGWGMHLGNPKILDPRHRSLVRTGVMAAREFGRIPRFRGQVVLCLGAGLGSAPMANAFIKAGASAFIGTTGTDPGRIAPVTLLFVMRLFEEMGTDGATVREAWERARAQDKESAKFRLYVASRGSRVRRAVMVSNPRSIPPVPGTPPDGLRRMASANWRLPALEVDLLTIPSFRIATDLFVRDMVEQWGMKVNHLPCRSPRELRDRLGGKGITAPIVLLESHGSSDKVGQAAIVAGASEDKSKRYLMGPGEVRRYMNLPGRVFVAGGCGLGAPELAEAFLRRGLRAYLGSSDGGGLWHTFLLSFFYELAVNRATVTQAWARAKAPNAALYPRGWKRPKPVGPEGIVVRAPALIEGFEGNTDNRYEGDWDTLFYEYLLGKEVPAPGGHPGLAYRLNFDFRKKKSPHIWIDFSGGGQHWIGARGFSLEVFVPHALRLSESLTFDFHVGGKRREYQMRGLALRRGWNTIRLAFDAPGWRGRERDCKKWRPERFDVEALQPVRTFWFVLAGRGRHEEGAVFFDNLRLEKNG
ncbi:MAG: hypothetical protein AAB152_02155 [Candidatus Coatesbacteria bacterium]